MLLPELTERVQLHEDIKIYYVVTGYIASLYTNDETKELACAEGTTIAEALMELEKKAAMLPRHLKDLRGPFKAPSV